MHRCIDQIAVANQRISSNLHRYIVLTAFSMPIQLAAAQVHRSFAADKGASNVFYRQAKGFATHPSKKQ